MEKELLRLLTLSAMAYTDYASREYMIFSVYLQSKIYPNYDWVQSKQLTNQISFSKNSVVQHVYCALCEIPAKSIAY